MIKNTEQLLNTKIKEEEIRKIVNKIRNRLIRNSKNIHEGNFVSINNSDLYLLFNDYMEIFFPILNKLLDMNNFSLRLSKRLTKTGGKTSRKQKMYNNTKIGMPYYQITISSTLLFQSFNNKREVKVNGIVCRDRLDALQRLFEHELIHMLEMLIWEKSSCRQNRFKMIVANIFGHSDVTHDLVTQNEIAREQGIKVGKHVKFEFEGRNYQGIVNRITKRTSILVKDPEGKLYHDGNRYTTFYIPLHNHYLIMIPPSINYL